MPGKVEELNRVRNVATALSRTATGIYYNNGAAGAAASGIDTQDYDESLWVINHGATTGTVAFDIYQNTTDTSAGSTAVTGASFGSVTAGNDNQLHIGRVLCKSTQRYLFLRANKTANANAGVYSAEVVLSNADKNPQSNSPTFTV
jgi:hypothetical protein